MKTILNLAAGKIRPLMDWNTEEEDTWTVNVDTCYANMSHDYMSITEGEHHRIENGEPPIAGNRYVCVDVNEFMERYKFLFDRITVYRYLEHVARTDVLYFIYLMSTCLKIGGVVDVIVPNYKTLAQLLVCETQEQVNGAEFESHDILLTTELLNEPSCPHASIWTRARLTRQFQLEGRFKVDWISEDYYFDGRDIYLRLFARRVA